MYVRPKDWSWSKTNHSFLATYRRQTKLKYPYYGRNKSVTKESCKILYRKPMQNSDINLLTFNSTAEQKKIYRAMPVKISIYQA